MEKAGLITHAGPIVDATFAEAPRQHNQHDKKQDLRQEKTLQEWKKPENIRKLYKKVDAQWTRKSNYYYYDYRDHAKADSGSKFIIDYTVTATIVYNNQPMPTTISETDNAVYADNAYWGSIVGDQLPMDVENHIQERRIKHEPLMEDQNVNNRIKSKTRCWIEHIFGYITGFMYRFTVRSVSIARAKFNIGLTTLIYKLCRFEFLYRSAASMRCVHLDEVLSR